MPEILEIFTDSSYDPVTKTAICGYMVNNNIYTKIIHDTTNTEAEIMAVLEVLEKFKYLDYPQNLTIYTDCQTVVNLISKRRYNKEIYKTFYEKYDNFRNDKCQIIKIMGHKSKFLRNDKESQFSKVDFYVRKELRKLRKIEAIT